jgi:hypothetical protein
MEPSLKKRKETFSEDLHLLPQDLFEDILLKLNVEDILTLSETSLTLQEKLKSSSNFFWKKFLHAKIGLTSKGSEHIRKKMLVWACIDISCIKGHFV